MLRIVNNPNCFDDQADLTIIPIDQVLALNEDMHQTLMAVMMDTFRIKKKKTSNRHGMLELLAESLIFVAQIWARSRDQLRLQPGRYGIDDTDEEEGNEPSDNNSDEGSSNNEEEAQRQENVVAIPF